MPSPCVCWESEPRKIANSASLLQKAGAVDGVRWRFPSDDRWASVPREASLVQLRQRPTGRRGQTAGRGRARHAAPGPPPAGAGALPRAGGPNEREGRGERVVGVGERGWSGPDGLGGAQTGRLGRSATSSAPATVPLPPGARPVPGPGPPDTAQPPRHARRSDPWHAVQRATGPGRVPAPGPLRPLPSPPRQPPPPAQGPPLRPVHPARAVPRLRFRDRDAW